MQQLCPPQHPSAQRMLVEQAGFHVAIPWSGPFPEHWVCSQQELRGLGQQDILSSPPSQLGEISLANWLQHEEELGRKRASKQEEESLKTNCFSPNT